MDEYIKEDEPHHSFQQVSGNVLLETQMSFDSS
jgi:hypothetical protein